MKLNKKNSLIFLFDAFIILFMLTINMSIIQDIVYGSISFAYRMPINIFIIVLSILLRFKLKVYNFKKLLFLPIIIFLIWFMDILQLILLRGSGIYMLTTYTLLSLYAYYIYNCLKYYTAFFSSYKKSYELILKPYIYFSIFNVTIVLLAFVLISSGLMEFETNPVEYSLLKDNIERGTDHFYPSFISIIRETQYRLPILNEIPMITGLTHEPHVLCFLIFPSLFFLLANQKIKQSNKLLILSVYLFIAVISMSTTTFLCLILIYSIHLIYKSIYENLGLIKLIIPLTLITIVLIYFGNTFKEILLLKTVVETGSRDYSSDLLFYMFNPESILGAGTIVIPNEIFTNKYQVGLLSSFLLIIFYIYFNVKIVYFIFSKNKKIHFIGLGLMYFSFHMLKLGNLIFHYPFLIYMIIVPFFYCLKLKSDKLLINNFNHV